MKMKVNEEEIFVIDYLKDSGMKLIYAPLRTSLFLVTAAIADKLVSSNSAKEKEKIIKYIKSKKLIDINRLHTLMTSVAPDLAISLTEDCNLACVYCHADAGTVTHHKSMSRDKIRQVISYYFEYLGTNYPDCREVRLSFMGGGEPTIRPRLMKYAIELAKQEATKREITLVITTATNGCFSKEIAHFIMDDFSHISLSFDGPAYIQNLHRPLKNGADSFDHVFRTAKYFQENSFPVAFRATLSTESIRLYKEIVDFFARKFPGSYIGLEPLNSLGRGSTCSLTPSPEQFAEGINKICDYAESKQLKVRNANIGKFHLLRTVFCNAVAAPSFTVTVNGEIWACSRDSAPDIFRYGYFDFEKGGVIIDYERLRKIKSINVFNFPECNSCFCKYHCAGDCPDNRYSNLLKCEATRQIGTHMLNNLANQTN